MEWRVSATDLLYSKSFVDGNILSVSQEMSVSHGLFFSWPYCYLGFSCVFPAAKSAAVPFLFDRNLAVSELEMSWEFSRHTFV